MMQQQNNVDENSHCDEGPREDRAPTVIKQVFAIVGPLLTLVSNGMVDGFSAILLHELNDANTEIKVDRSQASWIASMAPLVMAFGCLLSGWLVDRIGRRPTIIVFSLVSVSGWFSMYFGATVTWLLVGRFINGLCTGLSSSASICFIGEVSHPKYRGLFLSSVYLCLSIGTLLTNLLGTFMSWKTTILLSVVVPLGAVVMTIMMPESFIFYINHNKLANAKKSYVWFRGESEEHRAEFMEICKNRNQRVRKQTVGEIWENSKKTEFLKPLILATLVFFTSQMAGHNAVVFYCLTILKKSVKGLNEYVVLLILDVFRVIMAVMACLVTKRFKIRPLMITSGVGTAASLFLLSLLVYLSNTYPHNTTLSIVPILAFISYIIFLSFGFLSLKWAVCGQIFPSVTRGLGNGLSICVNFLSFFLVVKTNPDLTAALGTPGSFLVYATITLCGTSVIYYILPETKGKTSAEIMEYFTGKPKTVNNTEMQVLT